MDDGSIIQAIIIIVVLLFFAAYFAVCETAFASVNRVKVKVAFDRGDRRAKKALYVLDNFDKAITTILIGTNITHLVAASYVTLMVTRAFADKPDAVNLAVSISTVITTIAVFMFGEMLPKSIGKKYARRFSLSTAGSLRFFMTIFTPISYVLTAIGRFFAALTKGDKEITVTEDELHDIIEAMTDEGELEEEQGELVQSALDFGETTVDSILTARVDLDAINVASSPADVLARVKSAVHSRLPVYEESVDNIIGIMQVRKFIRTWLAEGENMDLRSILDEPYFIHSSTNIDELLQIMSAQRRPIAVVTDSYGGTLGIVTVEDIIEELVGEIWDEDDEVIETMVENSDGSFSFLADVDIEDAFSFMDYEDPDDFDFEHKLLGEWAYEQFDLIPSQGDSFEYNGLNVTVEEIENRRILKLRIVHPAPETEEGGED
ncbi:MAG: HlyC/CorC family transporter [Oscillospiraceae bacterium]|nr:HlyC/CorC family transporter [Oscillospiraceae bacterium]